MPNDSAKCFTALVTGFASTFSSRFVAVVAALRDDTTTHLRVDFTLVA